MKRPQLLHEENTWYSQLLSHIEETPTSIIHEQTTCEI